MRNLTSLLALVALTGSTLTSFAENDHWGCSSKTIEGTYAFRISGEIFAGPNMIYRDGIAMTHFDGGHLLTQVDYILANGVSAPAPTNGNGFHTDETGSYAVHEDCTGEAEIDFPTPPGDTSGAVLKLLFVISDDGRQLNTIVTSLTPPNSSVAVPANIHSDATRVRR